MVDLYKKEICNNCKNKENCLCKLLIKQDKNIKIIKCENYLKK